MSKISDLSNPIIDFSANSIEKMVENEALGLPLDFDEKNIHNPLMDYQRMSLYDNSVEELLDFMSRPENFYYTCKWLLNIHLLPFQVLMLQELWNRKFPMLIATRGGGKTFLLSLYSMLRAIFDQGSKTIVIGAAFRQSRLMFEYMETFWANSPILRNMVGSGVKQGPKRDIDRCNFYIGESSVAAVPLGDGSRIRGLRANYTLCDEFACLESSTLIQTSDGLIKISDFLNGNDASLMNIKNEFEYPDTVFRTPKTDVYHVVTQNGYSFKCSNIHKVMTTEGWKLAKDLTNNDFLELDCNDYFPERYIEDDGYVLDEDMAWIMGMLVSEGTVTNRNFIEITNTDRKIIDETIQRTKLFKWTERLRPAKKDHRGWDSKECHILHYGNVELRDVLYKWGIDYVTSHKKTIPSAILKSPRSVVIAFLQGLFLGDGSGFSYTSKGKKHVGVSYYSVHERLIDELQILLLKFGVTASKNPRKSKPSKRPQYMLAMRAENAFKMHKLLGLEKWKDIVDGCSYMKRKPKPMKNGNRYIIQTTRANKNVHIGTFDTIEECNEAFYKYWEDARPCFRVKKVEILPEQEVLYDFHMPETHTFYGNGFVQHNSIPLEIFEVVIRGFSSVSARPDQKVVDAARIRVLKSLGMYGDIDEEDLQASFGNQTVISGTAYYSFNHFYDYWMRYKQIIESKGDKKKLEEVFKGEVPDDFDWKQFSIFRVPWQKLPKGFMDETQITQAKATVHNSIYFMEYQGLFPKDSEGFFKRSLIEKCVCKEPINLQSGPVEFSATLRGNPNCEYIYGIDPASEQDNFALVILEKHDDHRRIVYSWSINRQELRERIKKSGKTDQKSFYTYCANKIRSLMKIFPTRHIGIDTQGGGIAIMEALHDPDECDGELPLWPYIKQGDDDAFWWEAKDKPTDKEAGLHILHMVQFANADFTRDANHGLRMDMEGRQILFPKFDSATIGESLSLDKIHGREYDTLEDCVMEIESLKDELATIIHSQTPTGRDKWDTPEVKLPGNKKGRLRKDRYSAVIIANMICRLMDNKLSGIQHNFVGGYAGQKIDKSGGQLYRGPEHIVSKMNTSYYGRGVKR